MSRTARLRIPGYPLHVVQRGHNRERCFFDRSQFELYLGLLGEFGREHGCSIHAYVLMPNHVHLLLSQRDPWAITRLMRSVNQRYVQHVNRSCKRTGSTWQGRYWASIVDTDDYFFICHRYVEQNPVRARLVADAGEYLWSSHGHNAQGAASLVVTPHELYLDLGTNDEARSAAYRAMFADALSDGQLQRIREAVQGGRPLGSEAFLENISARLGVRTSRGKPGPKAQGRAGT